MPQLVEVTNIPRHGFRALVNDEGLSLPFSGIHWFRDAAVGKILHARASPNHLHWPELDVALTVEPIRHPERFSFVGQS
jgi:hypothetical protein